MNKDLVDVKNYWEDLSKADIPNSLKDHWLDDNGNAVAESMYQEVADFVISFCQSNEAEILEVGCGTGRILEKIRSSNKGLNLTGIDLSEGQIIIAKENNKSANLHVGDLCAYAKSFPNLNGKFDVIFLHSVTQYFPSQEYFEEFLIQAKNLLSNKGTLLLIDVPNTWYKDLVRFDGLKISTLLREKIKDFLPSDIIKLIKKVRKKRTLWIEKIGGKELTLSAFIGFYPDPEFCLDFGDKNFKKTTMLYQPFKTKPLIYRKFRPIFIFDTKIDL